MIVYRPQPLIINEFGLLTFPLSQYNKKLIQILYTLTFKKPMFITSLNTTIKVVCKIINYD